MDRWLPGGLGGTVGGKDYNGTEKTFEDDGDIQYPVCSDGFMGTST